MSDSQAKTQVKQAMRSVLYRSQPSVSITDGLKLNSIRLNNLKPGTSLDSLVETIRRDVGGRLSSRGLLIKVEGEAIHNPSNFVGVEVDLKLGGKPYVGLLIRKTF